MSTPFDEALTRARGHLQRGLVEGVEGAQALLEAAVLASGGDAQTAGARVEELSEMLGRLLGSLRRGSDFELPRSLTEPLERALAVEIERWEARSRSDPNARPVLRAFLGFRELLWELGVRGEATTAPESKPASPSTPPPAPPESAPKPPEARPRVQRFSIEID